MEDFVFAREPGVASASSTAEGASGSGPMLKINRVRTNFAETWLWLDSYTGYAQRRLSILIHMSHYKLQQY